MKVSNMVAASAVLATMILPNLSYAQEMNWSGSYIGFDVGYGFGEVDAWTAATGAAPISGDTHGISGGIHAGHNVNFGSLIMGVEADISVLGVNGDPDYSAYASPDGYHVDQNWGGSLRVRAGMPIDNMLIYLTGGMAVANFDADYYSISTPLRNESRSGTHLGYVVGAGLEHAVSDSVSIRGEYLFADFGDEVYGYNSTAVLPANSPVGMEHVTHTLRLGLSYKF